MNFEFELLTDSSSFLANGYGRSEAVVLLYLQRAEEAKRIYATISHSDATFCGYEANTLLKPKQEALYHFLKQFYSTCNVSPRDIGYLEADGSADKVPGNGTEIIILPTRPAQA